MIIPALRIFAYVCIWTTPIQLAIVLWGLGIVILTDYSILSLTNIEFIRNYSWVFSFRLLSGYTRGSGILS